VSGTRDIRRRSFLIRSCQSAAALLLPGRSLDAQSPPADGEFHLHPHYRGETPLDAVRLKADARLDDFPSEKEHDKIAANLAQWSSGLLASPRNLQAIG
jgi:hypothetical protein